MYFYEPFLEAFDPDLRKELGVWYTPTQVIRYQVAKIDRLLREELGCPRGFADERVVVLDPACGTGAYLIEVLRYTARQLEIEGADATLAAKLVDAACRRFIGFEILTAPFVIAQLQLYLLLARVGLPPDEKHRPAVFLTNALTGPNCRRNTTRRVGLNVKPKSLS
jgi:predicted helicase